MKKLVVLVLVALGLAFAQEEAYQVPGFPPFDPALPILEVIEDRGDTVLVRHSYGETEVSKSPQRIFANVGLEVALPLGLNVVGGAFAAGSFREMPPTLRAATQDLTIFDAYDVPNLEAILSLQPDLIIDWHYEADPTRYEQFSRIAPTLSLLANPVYNWKQATRDMAAVFGLEARAEEVIRQYEAKVTEQCERIRSHVGDETLSLIRMRERDVTLDGPGTYGVFSDEHYTTWIITAWAYRDCRLTPGPEVAELLEGEPRANLSLELLPELRADHLMVLLDLNNTTADTFMGSRLWQSIPAVQNGKVYHMDAVWELGYYTDIYTLERVVVLMVGDTTEGVRLTRRQTRPRRAAEGGRAERVRKAHPARCQGVQGGGQQGQRRVAAEPVVAVLVGKEEEDVGASLSGHRGPHSKGHEGTPSCKPSRSYCSGGAPSARRRSVSSPSIRPRSPGSRAQRFTAWSGSSRRLKRKFS